jgi:hypothetical protein
VRELLHAWLIEVVVIGAFLWPLGMIASGLGHLKADRRARKQRRQAKHNQEGTDD